MRLRSLGRPRTRLVGWLLVGGVAAGFAWTGIVRVRERASTLWSLAKSIGSARYHNQLGPVGGLGPRARSLDALDPIRCPPK